MSLTSELSLAEKMFAPLLNMNTYRATAATNALSSGITLYQKGRYADAVACFKQATAYQPDMVDAYNYMANAFIQQGNNTEAIKAYKISVSLDRTQHDTYMSLGNVYVEEGNYTEAEKAYKSASSADPASVEAPYTLALMYLNNDRLDEAEPLLKKVIQMSPDDGNPYYALGRLYNEQEKYEDAVKKLTRAVNLKDDFTHAYYELGKAYANLAETDQAQKMIDKLDDMETSEAADLADELEDLITKPKIFSYNSGNSTFNPEISSNFFSSGVMLSALDPELSKPDSSKVFTAQFQFDSKMDVSSVMNISNWTIGKASGGTAGLYDNGLYRPTNVTISPLPESIVYDATTNQATVFFRISQNADGTGTLDPSRMVFKFSGTDIDGKTMDPDADQYDGFAGVF